MKLFRNDLEGSYFRRPNRFIVEADTGTDIIRAHCPNPGRMEELLTPSRRLIFQDGLKEHPSNSAAPARKTRYTLVGAYYRKHVVSLYSSMANKVAQNLIIPRLYPDALDIQPEITLAGSRFDFRITTEGKNREIEEVFLEVKACTFIEEGTAMFPDAPTTRGKRHIEELAALKSDDSGGVHRRGAVLFVIASPEATRFIPNMHTDPEFSRALLAARDSIEIHAVTMSTEPSGDTKIINEHVPVELDAAEPVRTDSGVYLMIYRIERAGTIHPGSLGEVTLLPGWYVYTGSAKRGLSKRISRHLRQRKRRHWHIDAVSPAAESIKAYPIYTHNDLECSLAASCVQLADGDIKGFGSSDCGCGSHFFYFSSNPMENEEFRTMLFKYRFSLAL